MLILTYLYWLYFLFALQFVYNNIIFTINIVYIIMLLCTLTYKYSVKRIKLILYISPKYRFRDNIHTCIHYTYFRSPLLL